jgi:hypothetical protein
MELPCYETPKSGKAMLRILPMMPYAFTGLIHSKLRMHIYAGQLYRCDKHCAMCKHHDFVLKQAESSFLGLRDTGKRLLRQQALPFKAKERYCYPILDRSQPDVGPMMWMANKQIHTVIHSKFQLYITVLPFYKRLERWLMGRITFPTAYMSLYKIVSLQHDICLPTDWWDGMDFQLVVTPPKSYDSLPCYQDSRFIPRRCPAGTEREIRNWKRYTPKPEEALPRLRRQDMLAVLPHSNN